MKNKNGAKTKKMKHLSIISVMLFFVFLIGLGFVWKAYFWFDLKFDADITELSGKYDVEKSLIYAIIKTESNFDEEAVSKKGATGLMQLMPDTGAFIAGKLGLKVFSLRDEKQNLEFGIYYVNYLKKKFSDENTAIAAYNAGETVVARWLDDKEYSEDGMSLKKIPYAETSKYVRKVNNFKKIYSSLY